MPIDNRDGKPLTLFRIQHELIADTSSEGWYRVMATGPYFRNRWSYGRHGDGTGFHDLVDEHRGTAACRAEPSLTVAWGMSIDSEDRHSTEYQWSQRFANKSVHGIWADFFWCGALIDRVELARIDGVHGLIPFPQGGGEQLTATEFEASVAALIHGLESGADYDSPARYLQELGVVLVPDQAREGAGHHE